MRHSVLAALVVSLLALPAAAMIITDTGGITATIQPGHTAVVFYAGYVVDPGTFLNVFKRGATIVSDSDGYGVVHVNLPSFPVRSTVLVFDLRQQTYEILPGENGTLDFSPLETAPIAVHGPGGTMSYLSLSNVAVINGNAAFAGVCLIRPNVGAWVQTTSDGGVGDADAVQNNRATVAVSAMQSAAGGPAAPADVQNGDWVFYAAPGKGYVLQQVVLPYPASAGRFVAFADPATKVGGKSIRVWISREMGSDGTATCSYSTKQEGSDAVRFQPVSGTLTFGPGETLKSFDIPTINDNTYSGAGYLEVDLTATGAPVDSSAFFLGFADDEPPPSLSVANVSVPDDGSESGTVPMTVTLTGATTLTATVDVYTDNDNPVSFAPGETSKSFNVPWTRSRVLSGLPVVQLFDPQNCTIARAQAYVTFRPNGLQIDLTPGSMPEGNSGTTNAAMPVTLSAPSTQTVTVDYATSDGTAKAGVDYVAVSGTLQFAPGETSKIVNVPVIGNVVQQHNRSFTLNLSNPNGAALPATSTYFVIVEDDVSTISTSDVSVPEGNSGSTTATVTVTLSCPSADPVTVSYGTANFTAFAGEDYVATSGTLRFDPGVVTQTISIPIIPNTTPQPNRAFRLALIAPSGATAGQLGATITILDDDPGPAGVLTPSDVSVLEGPPGMTNAAVDVALSQALPQAVTVQYATADVSARAGVDYVATSGTLTIPAGETHKSILVPINGNNVQEMNRYFIVTFSHPSGAVITKRTTTVTIVDDDVAVMSIPDVLVTQTSGVMHATLAVTLSCPIATTSYVSFRTVDGSAVAGRDYAAASGQLTFSRGQTQQTIAIDILGDPNAHQPRTFTVVLSDASNAAIGRGTATVTIVNGILPQHHRAAGR